MEPNLFRYIWRHSRRDQLIIFTVVLASLPFYFASLDLPRRIVNEAIQGKPFEKGHLTAPFLQLSLPLPEWLGGKIALFEGFQVERLTLLFGLSTLFLAFVLINGAFKYWINVSKGALGERMLRRMRFDLFALVLRFTPDALRTVKASETATIIKDEVEPIGGFIGDAFVLPAFLGTQAMTALGFILIQNVWLGLMAAAVVGVQFTIIPRLRRELLRLGKQRQLASRRLAGRVSEVVDGMEAIQVHHAHAWERAEIGQRLFELFDLRFRIYKRKFIVKFLNNLLAQMTPFFFYSFGGYFALQGELDVGQLVAVIAAYRELPPPLKELIDWDQQRLDVQVKYDQVVQHFSPERLLPSEEPAEVVSDEPLEGELVIDDLRVMDSHGAPIIDGASLATNLPSKLAVVADGGPAAGVFARILARRSSDFAGTVTIGGRNLLDLSKLTIGRRIAYAGVDPTLFPGTIRDNVLYGLRQCRVGPADEDSFDETRRIAEAKRTGNPVESVADRWVDLSCAGVESEDALDAKIIAQLKRAGLEDDIYRFGLAGLVDPEKDRELTDRLIEARTRLREQLSESGMSDLVEPFDPDRYNQQATLGENLLFGVPTSRALIGRNLADQRGFREAVDAERLTGDLVQMGARIAETMVEIFRGLPSGHPLFEQFSFMGAEELPEFEAILRRQVRRRGEAKGDDLRRLLALPLAYIEPRHRLGLLNDDLEQRIVKARKAVREQLGRRDDPGVEFYDQEQVCSVAPLKDNLLFGRVSHSAANAQSRVMEAITSVVKELELQPAIERVGLDHQVGPMGRMLNASQRTSVNLVRCLAKRPDIFVLDGALASFGETQRRDLLHTLIELVEDRTLVAVLPNERDLDGFDELLRFREGKLTVETLAGPHEPVARDVLEQADAEPLGKRAVGEVA